MTEDAADRDGTTDTSMGELPRVRRFRFVGFRSLRDVRLELSSRFNVLVGANGAGKSSILDGAHYLSQMLAYRPGEADYRHGVASLVFRDERSVEQLLTRLAGLPCLGLALATDTASVWLEAEEKDGDGQDFCLGWGSPDSLDREPPWGGEVGPGDVGGMKRLRGQEELDGLGRVVRLRLSSQSAMAASVPRSREPRVEHDGYGLPSTLAWLASNEPEARQRVERELAAVVPRAGRIRTPRQEIERFEEEYIRVGDELLPRQTRRQEWGDALEVEFGDAGFLPAAQLSEGTLLTLALLTVLHSPACPRLVLLDDIERALHPGAQRELVACVRRVLALRSDVQVLATTHSPYLLDCFEPSDVHVLALDAAGHTQVRRFDEHPRSAELVQALHLGEMWSGLGEQWVVGGQR